MSDEKRKPVDDLKEGLGLLFRAAKGAVEKLPTDKVESVAKDAAKEMGRAFESLGSELDKALGKKKPEAAATEAKTEPKKDEEQFDDAYAPEPPGKGPRVG